MCGSRVFLVGNLLTASWLNAGCGSADGVARPAEARPSASVGRPKAELHGGRVETPRVTDGGVEFRGVADADWKQPEAGSTTAVGIELRLKNLGDRAVRFKLIDSARLFLRAEGGAQPRYALVRDATPRYGWFSPPIARGETFVLSRTATLGRQADGSLRLSGPDGFGGEWSFEPLGPGRYALSFEYGNDTEKADDGAASWRGRVETPALTVTIR